MADPRPSDPAILKIFSGVQAGAEVTLAAGTYGLGSGPDDDIQLVDVSLKPGHARLRVSPGKIELAGGTGTLRTAAGIALGPDEPWREIEPLDLVTAGTTRFALGYPTSQWATITEAEVEPPAPVAAAAPAAALPWLSRERLRHLAGPAVALALLLAGGTWMLLDGGLPRRADLAAAGVQDLAAVRAALDALPFGRALDARQEVDGAIYVSGYVETPVERRAVTGALERTGVPARTRLWVLQTLRGEVESLIQAQRVAVVPTLDRNGELTLDGTILNAERANRFVALVRDLVLGLSGIDDRIRTAATLLTEVEKLAATSRIQPWILLRADGEVIEASGAIPVAKIDAWVGFLQGYARRFSREIPLRSLVQLQTPGSAPLAGTERAIVVGGQPSAGETALDLDRLRQGSFQLGEVFAAGSDRGGTAAAPTGGDERTGGPKPPGREAARPSSSSEADRPSTSSEAARPSSPGEAAGPSVSGEAAPAPAARAEEAPAATASNARPGAEEPRLATATRTGPLPDGATGREAQPAGPTPIVGADANTGREPRQAGLSPSGTGAGGGAEPVPGSRPGAGPAPEDASGRDPRSSGRPAPPPAAAAGGAGEGRLAADRSRDADRPAGPGNGVPPETRPAGGGAAAADAPVRPGPGAAALVLGAVGDRRTGGGSAALVPDPAANRAPEARAPVAATPAEETAADLAARSRTLVERWRNGTLDADPQGRALRIALDTLRRGSGRPAAQGEVPDWYLPLLAPRRAEGAACWPDAQLRAADIPVALFWLDILSASDGISLTGFNRDTQVLLLEAALNPDRTASCAGEAGREAVTHSLYLREVGRNPSFIRFITRDLAPFSLDITGVNLLRQRFVLTRAGRRMYEGAAPDRSSRLVVIGELGVAIQLNRGLAAVAFEPDLAWKITQ
ncbi:FHA domain-containing protein [uncultured Methylobacterium sp.]|uniref:FHA domain-containing protein n=1 Tax=uncultured Methylobacterium sp. TaxID=157278 RepID=UPI00262ED05E|nr:FHA domain-containing protein [uncultured Methylobacterium sp.]